MAQDYTDQYNTKLTPREEAEFQKWKAKYAPNDTGTDYDLRGAFKAGLTPDPQRGHWPDTFKKPNHPTFSNQSQYHGTGGNYGGAWGEDGSFTPSQTNLQHNSFQSLQQYFQKVEPGAQLKQPKTDSIGNAGAPPPIDMKPMTSFSQFKQFLGIN